MTHTSKPQANDPAPETPAAPKDRRRLPPPGVDFPKTIKSFVKRAGRTTSGQAKAMQELGPLYVLPYSAAPLDRTAVFGAEAANRPLILEIGFGMGDATAHIADLMRDKNFLGCEVHEPGVGALLKHIGERELSNLRILQHDAVEVLDHMLPEQSLDGVGYAVRLSYQLSRAVSVALTAGQQTSAVDVVYSWLWD